MFLKKKQSSENSVSIKTIDTINGRMKSSRPNGFIIGKDDNITTAFVFNEVKELITKYNDVQILLIDDKKRYNDLVKSLGGEIIEYTEYNSHYEYDEMLEFYISKKLESDNRIILFDISYPAHDGSMFEVGWVSDLYIGVSKCSPKQYKRWIYAHCLEDIFFTVKKQDYVHTLWEQENLVMTCIMDNPIYIYETKTSRDNYKYPKLTETLLNLSGYYLLIHTNIHSCEIINHLKFDKNMYRVLEETKFGLVSYDGENLSIFEAS